MRATRVRTTRCPVCPDVVVTRYLEKHLYAIHPDDPATRLFHAIRVWIDEEEWNE